MVKASTASRLPLIIIFPLCSLTVCLLFTTHSSKYSRTGFTLFSVTCDSTDVAFNARRISFVFICVEQ